MHTNVIHTYKPNCWTVTINDVVAKGTEGRDNCHSLNFSLSKKFLPKIRNSGVEIPIW